MQRARQRYRQDARFAYKYMPAPLFILWVLALRRQDRKYRERFCCINWAYDCQHKRGNP